MQGKEESLTDIARQSFAEDSFAAVLSSLDETTGRELERVRRAILMLSGGDVGKLTHGVAVAMQGDRDVLYWAEYPPSA